jgi:hypothetical protein
MSPAILLTCSRTSLRGGRDLAAIANHTLIRGLLQLVGTVEDGSVSISVDLRSALPHILLTGQESAVLTQNHGLGVRCGTVRNVDSTTFQTSRPCKQFAGSGHQFFLPSTRVAELKPGTEIPHSL